MYSCSHPQMCVPKSLKAITPHSSPELMDFRSVGRMDIGRQSVVKNRAHTCVPPGDRVGVRASEWVSERPPDKVLIRRRRIDFILMRGFVPPPHSPNNVLIYVLSWDATHSMAEIPKRTRVLHTCILITRNTHLKYARRAERVPAHRNYAF